MALKMTDVTKITKQMALMVEQMQSLQKQLDALQGNIPTAVAPSKSTDGNLFLMRRKNVLAKLGLEGLASRSSWSHDRGDAIIFDAWDHHWERDADGNPARYSLRTNGEHYNLAESRRNPRRGHTRWQHHVDMVVAGQREAMAIIPVANDPYSKPNKGSKGWLPQSITGHIQTDNEGQIWFYTDSVVPL